MQAPDFLDRHFQELAQRIEEQRRELDRIRDQSHRMKAQQQKPRCNKCGQRSSCADLFGDHIHETEAENTSKGRCLLPR